MKQIILTKKNVYGNELTYPVNDDAKIFARLVKKKTLDGWDIQLIEKLGYEIIYQ